MPSDKISILDKYFQLLDSVVLIGENGCHNQRQTVIRFMLLIWIPYLSWMMGLKIWLRQGCSNGCGSKQNTQKKNTFAIMSVTSGTRVLAHDAVEVGEGPVVQPA